MAFQRKPNPNNPDKKRKLKHNEEQRKNLSLNPESYVKRLEQEGIDNISRPKKPKKFGASN